MSPPRVDPWTEDGKRRRRCTVHPGTQTPRSLRTGRASFDLRTFTGAFSAGVLVIGGSLIPPKTLLCADRVPLPTVTSRGGSGSRAVPCHATGPDVHRQSRHTDPGRRVQPTPDPVPVVFTRSGPPESVTRTSRLSFEVTRGGALAPRVGTTGGGYRCQWSLSPWTPEAP